MFLSDQEPKKRYSVPMMVVHWLMAMGILGVFGMGLFMVDIAGITPLKLKLFNWHKWLGVTLFVVLLLRIVLKWRSKAPPYPAHWDAKTVLLVKLGHLGLYALMLSVPLVGYLHSLTAGYPVVWFGVFELPVFLERDEHLNALFKILHEWGAYGLIGLVAGHVVMALKHHVLDKEGILGRMIPGMKAD